MGGNAFPRKPGRLALSPACPIPLPSITDSLFYHKEIGNGG
jgi:hypothetical protein